MSDPTHDQFAASLRGERTLRPRDSKGRAAKVGTDGGAEASVHTVALASGSEIVPPVVQPQVVIEKRPTVDAQESISSIPSSHSSESVISMPGSYQAEVTVEPVVEASGSRSDLHDSFGSLTNSVDVIRAEQVTLRAEQAAFEVDIKAQLADLARVIKRQDETVLAMEARQNKRLDEMVELLKLSVAKSNATTRASVTPNTAFHTPYVSNQEPKSTGVASSSFTPSRSEPVKKVKLETAIASVVKSAKAKGKMTASGSHPAEDYDDLPPLADDNGVDYPDAEADDYRPELDPSSSSEDEEEPVRTEMAREAPSSRRYATVVATSPSTPLRPAVLATAATTGVDSSLIAGLRKAIPDYYGNLSKPAELDDFLEATDRYWRRGQLPGDMVVDAIIGKLKGNAHTWWIGLKQEGNQPTDWAVMRELMRPAFTAKNLDAALRARLWNITQRKSVQEYIDAFQRVAVQIPGLQDAEASAAFQKGLRAEILEHMDMYDLAGRPLGCTALKKAALDRELQWKAARLQKTGPSGGVNHIHSGGDSSSNGKKKKQQKRPPGQSSPKKRGGKLHCAACGRDGHDEDHCYEIIGTPSERAAKKRALQAKRGADGKSKDKKSPKSAPEAAKSDTDDEAIVQLILHTDARSVHAVMLDSGAQISVVHERLLLDNYKAVTFTGKITAANGTTLTIVGSGSVTIRDHVDPNKWIMWTNVYHCTNINRNVLAVTPLLDMDMVIKLGGANPGIFDADNDRVLSVEAYKGLTFLKGFVHTDSEVLVVEVDRSLTDFSASGNEKTATSENYGIVDLATLEKRLSAQLLIDSH